jgi:hypothetical protein
LKNRFNKQNCTTNMSSTVSNVVNDGSEDPGNDLGRGSPPSVGHGGGDDDGEGAGQRHRSKMTELQAVRSNGTAQYLGPDVSPGKTTSEVADYLELRLGKIGEANDALSFAIKTVIENEIDGDVWLDLIGEQSMTKREKAQVLAESFGIVGAIAQSKLISDADKAVRQARIKEQAEAAELRGAARYQHEAEASPGKLGVNDLSRDTANKSRLSTGLRSITIRQEVRRGTHDGEAVRGMSGVDEQGGSVA